MIMMRQRKIITRNWEMMMMMNMHKMEMVMTKLLKMRMRILRGRG